MNALGVVNRVVGKILALLLAPFGGMAPWVGLAAIATVFGAGMLVLFKLASNQSGLDGVKRSIHASLFELRLFNDDLLLMARALRGILRATGTYLRLSVVPLVAIAPVFVLLAGHLQDRYAVHALHAGEAVVVTATAVAGGGRPEIALEAQEGLRVETGPVWVPSRRELAWRIRPEREGRFAAALVSPAGREAFDVLVGPWAGEMTPVRSRTLADLLLHPRGRPLAPGTGVSRLELHYPVAAVEVGPLRVSWLLLFLAVSMVAAVLLRRPLGVTF